MQKIRTAIVSAISRWGFHRLRFGSGSLTQVKGIFDIATRSVTGDALRSLNDDPLDGEHSGDVAAALVFEILFPLREKVAPEASDER